MNLVLRYEAEAKSVYNQLKKIKRTGWVMRGVRNPETVYDHTVALVKMAAEMQGDLDINDSELDELQHMLEIHDWAESLVGDEYVPNENPEEYANQKKIKAQKESEAMDNILKEKHYKKQVRELFDRYEAGTDPVAKLAKQLDKLQALQLALTYEREQGIEMFKSFYEHYQRTEDSFLHPEVVKRVEKLQDKHKSFTIRTQL